jgi:hypothetical protein
MYRIITSAMTFLVLLIFCSGIGAQDTDAYNKALAEALLLQLKADSLARIVRDKRILSQDTPDFEMKKQLLTEIGQTDKAAELMQLEADQKFTLARSLKAEEKPVTIVDDSLIELTKEINGIKVYQYRPSGPVSEKKTVPIADEFALLEKSPYNDARPIPRGIHVLPGLVYRIQLGAFSTIRPNDAFWGISPVACEQVIGHNVFKYYAGLFRSINAVTRALAQVRLNGFPDAFIVAFFDGQLISTEKARNIEFEGFKLQ